MDRDEWNQRYDTTDMVWTANPNQTFVGEVESLPPGRALDIAAGEGRNAVWLAQRGWQVTAVDFADVALDKARQLAEANDVEITTIVDDVVEYVPEPGGFDLVAVIYLHIPEEQRRLVHRRAADAVAPGGTLVVLGHDSTNIDDGYGGPQDPAVLFSPDDVVDDLAGTDLSVEKSQRVDRVVTTEDGPRTAIDALVTLRRPG